MGQHPRSERNLIPFTCKCTASAKDKAHSTAVDWTPLQHRATSAIAPASHAVDKRKNSGALSALPAPAPLTPTTPFAPAGTGAPQWDDPPYRPSHCRHRCRARRARPARSELFSCAGCRSCQHRGKVQSVWAQGMGFGAFGEGVRMGLGAAGGTAFILSMKIKNDDGHQPES